ncbi:glycoside hydrolase [Pseudozobellia sp. WGM2]|uniref:glycoside hydrolase n=1 Tax=Pseudozobellia sp. WGM2 TaxID=2787625 RepID=UPI001AE05A2D|nr:glycoside hydrolase [Pseudozobellia sp. WGM2]
MKQILLIILLVFDSISVIGQETVLEVEVDCSEEYQTIHNFAASDAWAAQFTGLWPNEKRTQMADWLFSMKADSLGSPLGIGLSAWRFNIGAGSAKQDTSGIKDQWRRAEGFLNDDDTYDWTKQQGQQWFLQAAKLRGVTQFIAFVNSPPVQLTRNNRAHSTDGLQSNLPKENYRDYANFLANVVQHFSDSLDIKFKYLSPFNEPQWEWKGGQEGSPWNNNELASATKVIDSVFLKRKLNTQLEITEAGAIDYLTGRKKKFANRSNQIEVFYNPDSPHYIGKLKSLAPKVAAHSYFTTWDIEKLKNERLKIKEKLDKYLSLEYWMSEYCILENNEEIKGKGRDLGMATALYVARLIHADLTIANASAWHWWLAMSPYDFKDGLIYHDKNVADGAMYDSKLLWGFGNYSRFVRPYAKRIKVHYPDNNSLNNLKNGVLISAYKNQDGSIAMVLVNQKKEHIKVSPKINGMPMKNFEKFVTDKKTNLSLVNNEMTENKAITLNPRSITTLVFQKE